MYRMHCLPTLIWYTFLIMSLFSSPTETVRALWRIDSTGVSLTLYINQKLRIIHYDYQPFTLFSYDDRHQYDQLLHHVQLLMQRMINTIPTNGNRISTATIVLGEPWSHTVRRQVTYQRKTPFKLTKTFISDLIARDQKKMIHELRSLDPVSVSNLLDPYYHAVSIGGHTISDPWGRVVNDITIDYSTGFSDVQLVTIATTITHEKMKVPMISIDVDHFQNFLIRFLKKTNLDQSIVIDPTGYTTDLVIIQNKSLVQTGTLPTGISSLRYQMAESLGMYPSELNSLLSLYVRQLLAPKIVNHIENIMNKLFMVWEKDFQKFCNSAVVVGDVMNQVVWITETNDPLVQFFMHTLSQDQAQFPVVFGSVQVTFVSIDSFVNTTLLSDYGNVHDRIILDTL